MQFSELTNELDAALSAFQGEMPVIKKDVSVKMKGVSKNGNEFNVNYEYAPLEAIQMVANPLLSKHGLNVSQHLGFDDKGPIVYTRVGHKSGQWIMSAFRLDFSGVSKEQDKGSKITYSKRYSFVAALNIALSDEDIDAVGVAVEQDKQQKPAPKPEYKKTENTNPNDYIIQLGKNKMTGTRLQDHTFDYLSKCVNDTIKWHKDNNKTMHSNTQEFVNRATDYLKSQPNFNSDESIPF